MGDEDAGTGTNVVGGARKKLFKPADAFNVQVVGWFIQEQEVRRAARFGKSAGDGEALLPTAGEALDGFVHARFGEAEFAKDHAAKHFGLVMIAVHRCSLHGGGGGGHARREAVVKVITLWDVDNHCAALRAHDAFVRLFRAGKHAQERGLACAVRADEADAVTVGDADTHPMEEFAQAVGLGKIRGDEEHGRWDTAKRRAAHSR